jgi:hypothetical protein
MSHSLKNFFLLPSDNISVTALRSLLLVTSETIGNRVSVVVLWMGVEGFSSNCYLCDMCHWGMGISDRPSGISVVGYLISD